jgi:bacterioferritin (cytochrome b1)
MSGPTPTMIAWLQRALRHEFSASRQFALQAAVARSLGLDALARHCEASAAEEIGHAQRFAAALLRLGASFGGGACEPLPVGASARELLAHASATEARAVSLYRDAARACAPIAWLRELFDTIGAEEAHHLRDFEQRLAALRT